MKIRRVVSCRRTGIHDEVNSRFSQILRKAPKKKGRDLAKLRANSVANFFCIRNDSALYLTSVTYVLDQWFPNWAVLPPWGAVGLPRWALIGTRGGRERCYYHRGALVDK
jgi:hypothetical protein